jgi:[protein-PII] uridylyltransferase
MPSPALVLTALSQNPSSIALDEFAATLPASYRRNFDARAVQGHMELSLSRGQALVAIGAFPSNRPGTALCVVAEDRPGLLATISAALVLSRLDVIEAEAYTRRQAGHADEAVDVFWVRHDPPELRREPVNPKHVAVLVETLTNLLTGKVDSARLSEPSIRPPATPSSTETVVRFIEADDGSFATLEVETGDRSGLLLALAQALFNQRVQIVASQVRTTGTRVYDRFSIVEFDGSPINPGRRLEIQVAVLTAVDPLIGHRVAVARA